jgi:hypothetical protein
MQRSPLLKAKEISAPVEFHKQLDENLAAEALTDEDRYLSVLNIVYTQSSGEYIGKATLAEERDLVPRVSDSSIAN